MLWWLLMKLWTILWGTKVRVSCASWIWRRPMNMLAGVCGQYVRETRFWREMETVDACLYIYYLLCCGDQWWSIVLFQDLSKFKTRWSSFPITFHHCNGNFKHDVSEVPSSRSCFVGWRWLEETQQVEVSHLFFAMKLWYLSIGWEDGVESEMCSIVLSSCFGVEH